MTYSTSLRVEHPGECFQHVALGPLVFRGANRRLATRSSAVVKWVVPLHCLDVFSLGSVPPWPSDQVPSGERPSAAEVHRPPDRHAGGSCGSQALPAAPTTATNFRASKTTGGSKLVQIGPMSTTFGSNSARMYVCPLFERVAYARTLRLTGVALICRTSGNDLGMFVCKSLWGGSVADLWRWL